MCAPQVWLEGRNLVLLTVHTEGLGGYYTTLLHVISRSCCTCLQPDWKLKYATQIFSGILPVGCVQLLQNCQFIQYGLQPSVRLHGEPTTISFNYMRNFNYLSSLPLVVCLTRSPLHKLNYID